MSYPYSTPPYPNPTPPPQPSPQLPPSFAPDSHIWYQDPSPAQGEAVAILRGVPISTILSWLESIRSSHYSGNTFGFSQPLPREYLAAVSTLSVCSNGLIQIWLNEDRQLVPLNASQNSYGNNSLNYGSRNLDSFAQSPSSFGGSPAHATPRDDWDEVPHNLSRGTSVRVQSSSTAAFNKYDRWCFICHRHQETFPGYIRHIKEHYTTFYCIPEGSVQSTEDGSVCAVCGLSDPDPVHLNTHNVPGCVGKKFNRKGQLAQHLEKKHHVHQASSLIDQSEYTVHQKFFACGFCVLCFVSLDKLAHHVDALHYRHSAEISDWDINKVVQGLLWENAHWRRFLAAHPHLQYLRITWNPTRVKQLKHRLEMGREPADVLYKAAIEECRFESGQRGRSNSMAVTSFQDSSSCTHSSTELENLSSLTPYTRAPDLQSQNSSLDWDGANNFDRNSVPEPRPSPQIGFGSSTSTMHHYVDRQAQPSFSWINNEGFMQHQHQIYPFANTPAGGGLPALAGQAGTWSGYSLGAPRDGPTHPRTQQVSNNHVQSAPPRSDWHPPTSEIQSVSSIFPPNRQLSPLCYPDLAANTVRREMRDHRSTGMDYDSNDRQRFVQDRDGRRQQGRYL